MILPWIVFMALLVIGVPIAFALGLGSVMGLLSQGSKLITVPTRMFTGIDSFVLLAAPFYILAGEIMNRGGVTDRLIQFSRIVTGRLRGGSAYACTLASVIFAGISGTAIADTAALGQVFIKGMPKEGYTKEYSAAVVIAGSVIGPIIPPSVIMVIYGAVTQISVVDLFISGVIPGLLLGTALSAVIAYHARGGRLPRATVNIDRKELPRVVVDTCLVVSLPLFIVVGTVSGAFTATEAGGVACIYAMLLGWFAFQHLTGRELWAALVVSARTSATLFLVVAAATVAAHVLAMSGIADFTQGLGVTFAGRPMMFMLAVMLLLLLVGCFMDPGAAVILFVPLLMPAARSMHLDILQFSMLVNLTLTIGVITPPVGVSLFVAMRIGEIGMWKLVKETFPFLFAEVGVVILLILYPPFSSWLPTLLRR
jgi:TRAP-type transport system large permease protein